MSRDLPPSAPARLAVAVGVGVAAGAVTALLGHPLVGTLVAVTVTHVVLVTLGWTNLWPLDAAATRANARREGFSPVAHEVIVSLISVGAVLAIAVVLGTGSGDLRTFAAAVALIGVFASWASLHLMYATRYAQAYYGDLPETPTGDDRGIDWNADGYAPRYSDFFYFSYNLGMTFQVSDTAVTSPRIRAMVLRHCLLAYVFGAVVLAGTINLVSGIVTA